MVILNLLQNKVLGSLNYNRYKTSMFFKNKTYKKLVNLDAGINDE